MIIIGKEYKYLDKIVTVIEKIPGNKTKKGNYQGGILTGYKSKPPTYILSNGYRVRGNKLKPIYKK